MSFINKVVEIVSEYENVDAKKNLTKLNSEIRTYQSRIRKHIDENYAKFLEDVGDNDDFIQQCEVYVVESTQFLNHLKTNSKDSVEKVNEDVVHLKEV